MAMSTAWLVCEPLSIGQLSEVHRCYVLFAAVLQIYLGTSFLTRASFLRGSGMSCHRHSTPAVPAVVR